LIKQSINSADSPSSNALVDQSIYQSTTDLSIHPQANQPITQSINISCFGTRQGSQQSQQATVGTHDTVTTNGSTAQLSIKESAVVTM